jgi:hypothetical protein
MLWTQKDLPDDSWIAKYRAAIDQAPLQQSTATGILETLNNNYNLAIARIFKISHHLKLRACAKIYGELPTAVQVTIPERHTSIKRKNWTRPGASRPEERIPVSTVQLHHAGLKSRGRKAAI